MKLILFLSLTLFFGSLSPAQENRKAVFAGGCFWCMQPPFDKLKSKGVIATAVGYTAGHKDNPTYKEVSAGTTGHFEAIEITFNPKKISFKDLLNIFWVNIDPYDSQGQFCDKGEQYLSAVFYSSETEKKEIEDSIKNKKINTSKMATKILEIKKFYPAEEYHQEYYLKNSIRYKFYRNQCGRDKRLNQIWN